MLFSVVTPSYNQGAFIRKCLDSVRDQQGDFEVEHIVLDNCSTDATGAELQRHSDNSGRVKFTAIVEHDGGQTAAINKGFSLSRGDVVCWLNTDEWYKPGALEAVHRYFGENPDVDAVFGDCDFVDMSGHVVKRRREQGFLLPVLIYYECNMPSCATFVRRRVLDSGLFPDPEFKVMMDVDWYIRIARSGFRIAHLAESLACFTWTGHNICISFPERKDLERHLVLERFSGIGGPAWFRGSIYFLARWFWIGVRVLRRIYARSLDYTMRTSLSGGWSGSSPAKR
jgi:glycosyltransferase involved in cell wall biosynthesis